ncbi:hypothetical protein D3C80_925060 [compost metagenome]
MTAAKRSPTMGSVSHTVLVAPAMRAVRAVWTLSSRPISTPVTVGAAPPRVTIHEAPSARADTVWPSGAGMRMAVKSGPAAQRALAASPALAAAGTFMRAAASNTTQTASPRRKTAAPTGAAQAKVSRVVASPTSAVTGTAPPAGTTEGLAPSGTSPGA